jgi:glycosyltransferase involved in cell wall biosynthesis
MTFETPLIVHDVPPLPEVMGNAGIVIDKHSPELAAAKIDALWGMGAEYSALVRACRQRALAFTETALSRRLFSLFDGLSSSD